MARTLPIDPAVAGRITALLGPTNTGKTYTTLQRMMAYSSGMIGLPLRLLAREVYDTLVAEKGVGAVALITGEERRVPHTAKYWVCTTESMPIDKPVAFLAVDEVQLAGDRHRGHVFTDRILRARGVAETWFLGSDTIEPLLRELVPTVEVRRQPRLSELRFSGHHKLHAVPARAAIVAFSTERVMAIADRLRARHGGAAVVTGALSPRARNAQVGLFASGDVQHLVATDAIGMGLNLDLHHVALAATSKFDGRERRPLRVDELAQIAGRAGRFRRNGTFGTTDDAEPPDDETIAAVESHTFPLLKRLYWRAGELELDSLAGLQASLEATPPRRFLVPVRDADDALALARLAAMPGVRDRARGRAAVALLWEVCRVPDFGHVLPEHHATLLAQVYERLCEHGELSDAWLGPQLARLDRTDGDVDVLMSRVGALRVWSYICHRAGWAREGWADRAGALEDRLSDALHQRLVARFLDHRAGVVVGDLPPREADVLVRPDGQVRLGGRPLGRVRGLAFEPDAGQTPSRPVLLAVQRAVVPELRARVAALEKAPDSDLGVDPTGGVRWGTDVIARLVASDDARGLRVKPVRSDALDGPERERVQRRLDRWLSAWIDEDTRQVRALPVTSAAGRVVQHGLLSGPGAVLLREVADAVRTLPPDERARLGSAGVRFGQRFVWLPRVLERAEGRAVRYAVTRRQVLELPEDPRLPFEAAWPADAGQALGFARCGRWWVRVDAVEAVLAGGEKGARGWGMTGEALDEVVAGLVGRRA